MKILYPLLFLSLLSLVACTSAKKISNILSDDGKIDLVLLQINDVYEIAPLEGGKTGGMARVATLKKQLLKENPNTLTILSGDFLNPSVIGTIKYQGEKIKGAQMIDVMNHLGVDLVTFGNHEFDLKQAELQERLNESNAVWLGTNVLLKSEDKIHAFYHDQNSKGNLTKQKYIQEMWIWEVSDADGTQAKIGFFGATIDSNPKDYVIYEDFKIEAIKAYQFLAQHTDLVLGVTHLEISEDLELAALLQEVPLLMGGHEHVNIEKKVGKVRVTKADANAKSAYVHKIQLNVARKEAAITSQLIPINESIALDSAVNEVVNKWTKISVDVFSKEGFNVDEILTNIETPLDGREISIRHKQTNLGALITKAISSAYDGENDAAILNSGSIRIDDQIVGEVTQFDIIRAMPFGGGISRVTMTGALLEEVLVAGMARPGNGSFLQWDKIEQSGTTWKINGAVLQKDKEYRIVLNDFLMKGLDIAALKEDAPGVLKIEKPTKDNIKSDIRLVVIDYLKNI